jgi:plastocyanin
VKLFLLSVLALLLAAPAVAGNAVIRGTVRLPGGIRPVAIGPAAPVKGMRDVVVFLDSIPAKVEKKLARERRDSTILQIDRRFIPRVLPVPAGTTVRFENMDRVYHNVFSVSPVHRFDVGKYAPGESRRVTFRRPGVVRVFCDIDPDETGWVVVTPNHAYLRPDPAGGFQFPKLPRGKYKLTVWHPRHGQRTRSVEIPRRGDLVLDLRF